MMRLEIPAGTRAPNHYGVAYSCFARDSTIFYPVPLHLLVRHVRNFWFWLRYTKSRTFRERTEHALFEQGRAQGYQEVQENFLEALRCGAGSLRQWLDGLGMEIRVKEKA